MECFFDLKSTSGIFPRITYLEYEIVGKRTSVIIDTPDSNYYAEVTGVSITQALEDFVKDTENVVSIISYDIERKLIIMKHEFLNMRKKMQVNARPIDVIFNDQTLTIAGKFGDIEDTYRAFFGSCPKTNDKISLIKKIYKNLQ